MLVNAIRLKMWFKPPMSNGIVARGDLSRLHFKGLATSSPANGRSLFAAMLGPACSLGRVKALSYNWR